MKVKRSIRLNANLGNNEDGADLRCNQLQGYLLKYKSYIHNACGILLYLIYCSIVVVENAPKPGGMEMIAIKSYSSTVHH